MAEKLTPYDPAAALVNNEEIAFFMADALESGDPSYIAYALGIIARAKGMMQIASQAGLSVEQLYRSFNEDNPTLKTTLAVIKALGIKLTAKAPVDQAPAEQPPLPRAPGRTRRTAQASTEAHYHR